MSGYNKPIEIEGDQWRWQYQKDRQLLIIEHPRNKRKKFTFQLGELTGLSEGQVDAGYRDNWLVLNAKFISKVIVDQIKAKVKI